MKANRNLLWLLTALTVILNVTAHADDSQRERERAERMARMERRDKIEGRIRETEPKRRDGPARAENISDNEVREIQQVVYNVLPHAIVNISTVVSGCPCEDGPQCKDQVWLLASKDDKSYELQLSRINGHWMIGPIQKWWLKYKELKFPGWGSDSYEKYMQARNELIDSFPECVK